LQAFACRKLVCFEGLYLLCTLCFTVLFVPSIWHIKSDDNDDDNDAVQDDCYHWRRATQQRCSSAAATS